MASNLNVFLANPPCLAYSYFKSNFPLPIPNFKCGKKLADDCRFETSYFWRNPSAPPKSYFAYFPYIPPNFMHFCHAKLGMDLLIFEQVPQKTFIISTSILNSKKINSSRNPIKLLSETLTLASKTFYSFIWNVNITTDTIVDFR